MAGRNALYLITATPHGATLWINYIHWIEVKWCLNLIDYILKPEDTRKNQDKLLVQAAKALNGCSVYCNITSFGTFF